MLKVFGVTMTMTISRIVDVIITVMQDITLKLRVIELTLINLKEFE